MDEDRQLRRLTTILAADAFGYSRLTADNEEETLRTLKAHRAVIDRLISRHEGRIFNTAGDSVLAEFNSAVEAVRCAIAIQEELRVRNAKCTMIAAWTFASASTLATFSSMITIFMATGLT